MEFPPTVTWHELGGRALDVIGRTASRCLILAWAADFFMVEEIRGIRFPDPCLTCPEEDLLERVVLGGMARGLVNLALEYQTMAAQGGRPTPDPNAIAEGATIGVREAQRGFVEALQENVGTNPELARRFDSAARQNELRAPDLGLRRVRIALEAIQITDPLDPALIEDALDIAVRVVVDGNLLASRVFEQVHIQDPDRRGIVLRIDEVLAEVTMWEGSALGISLAASDDATGVTPRPEDYRGSVVLDGPPQTWDRVRRTPGWPQDTWRAWIRIDVED